jgi:shikimate kinase
MVVIPNKPIVLLGFMGSGKSTLGKQLSTLLGWVFVDLDRFVETSEKRTIPDIFEKDGEQVFRRLESNALKDVLKYPNQVIAIGGGTPCQPENLNLIKEKSVSVYLKISDSQLATRLTNSTNQRPLLKGKSESEINISIRDLLAAREPFYNQADIIIESDVITAEMIRLFLK